MGAKKSSDQFDEFWPVYKLKCYQVTQILIGSPITNKDVKFACKTGCLSIDNSWNSGQKLFIYLSTQSERQKFL